MKILFVAALAAVGLDGYVQAGTVTYTWNFDSPGGTLGTSQTYTNQGLSITAYGLTCTSSTTCRAVDLYGKNSGTGEQGLGINGELDGEINPGSYVQLDISNILALAPTSGSITIDSVQSGETFTLWANNAQGAPGTQFDSGTRTGSSSVVTLSANNPGSYVGSGYDFLSVGASSGNVLLSTITASVNTNAPEPATFALVGGALIGLASLRRRSKGRS